MDGYPPSPSLKAQKGRRRISAKQNSPLFGVRFPSLRVSLSVPTSLEPFIAACLFYGGEHKLGEAKAIREIPCIQSIRVYTLRPTKDFEGPRLRDWALYKFSSSDSLDTAATSIDWKNPMGGHVATPYYIYFYVFTCEHCQFPHLDVRFVPTIPQDQIDNDSAVWTCAKCNSPQSTVGYRKAAYAKKLLMSDGKCTERVNLNSLPPPKVIRIDRASASHRK